MNDLRTLHRLDRMGIAVSSLCAIHCALSPLLIALLPVAGLRVLGGERTEWVLVSISVLMGAASLLPSYIRHHRRAHAVVAFVAGVFLIAAARLLLEGELELEASLVVIGALFIAGAHAINRRLCKACSSCKADA